MGAGALGWVVWTGAGIPHSQGVFLIFYPPHMEVGMPVPIYVPLCTTPCLQPLCVSTPPTCLDECGFFKSLVVRLPHDSVFLTILGDTCFVVQLYFFS